jgi:hypothetical protein
MTELAEHAEVVADRRMSHDQAVTQVHDVTVVDGE